MCLTAFVKQKLHCWCIYLTGRFRFILITVFFFYVKKKEICDLKCKTFITKHFAEYFWKYSQIYAVEKCKVTDISCKHFITHLRGSAHLSVWWSVYCVERVIGNEELMSWSLLCSTRPHHLLLAPMFYMENCYPGNNSSHLILKRHFIYPCQFVW